MLGVPTMLYVSIRVTHRFFTIAGHANAVAAMAAIVVRDIGERRLRTCLEVPPEEDVVPVHPPPRQPTDCGSHQRTTGRTHPSAIAVTAAHEQQSPTHIFSPPLCLCDSHGPTALDRRARGPHSGPPQTRAATPYALRQCHWQLHDCQQQQYHYRQQ